MGEDPESVYAYYCLHEFHLLPTQYINLSENERAFIIAAIDIKIKQEKEARDKARREMKQ